MNKYIFVVGGVMSGVGKGVATSSIGALLQARGFKVTAVKIDPYINLDAGTMNPVEHGEVFVTDDGVECDQDIGNYERFLNQDIPSINYMTTGLVYNTVIQKERNLDYGGKSVEVVPHIPEEVIRRIKKASSVAKADFTLVEIGGTVGEYQNLLFLEAARMMHLRNPKDVLFVLVSYLPMPSIIGEMKTKPTQHAVRTLNSAGIQPDIIIARSGVPLDDLRKQKIATFCNIANKNIISAPDIKTSIYEIPKNFENENMGRIILSKFNMKYRSANMKNWEKLLDKIYKTLDKDNVSQKNVNIGIIGKYFETGDFILSDSYLSVIEAIKHASWQLNVKPEIHWLKAKNFIGAQKNLKILDKFDGIVVPGGFGSRGVEGKLNVIEYCRKKNIPFFGLCFGMQLAVVEFARNVCGLKDAHSTEIQKNTKHPVIDIMEEQKENIKKKEYGATMRLGAYLCDLKKGSNAYIFYGKQNQISERHRHRYELNNNFIDILEKKGLLVSGVNPDNNLAEIIELTNHPFFIATQFHPEFKSRPFSPHPLFSAFIKISLTKNK